MFPYYTNIFFKNLNVHTYNTRHNDNFRTIERSRLRVIQWSFLHKGIKTWNSLDRWKLDHYSLSTFKKIYFTDNL